MKSTDLENYLLKNIPLAATMGINVEVASLKRLVLSAPLAPNINHKKTVFGGSLHSVATLACWSLLHVNLSKLFDSHVQIVIASSEAAYLLPVNSDFKAECCMPDALEWERFLKFFKKKGKARIKLEAKIYQEEKLCVDYTGSFVAINMESNGTD